MDLLQLDILFLGGTSDNVNVKSVNSLAQSHMIDWYIILKFTCTDHNFIFQDFDISMFLWSSTLERCAYPSALFVPQQGLKSLQQLVQCQTNNEAVAIACLNTFLRHLWSLSEILIGLAFFDDEVPVDNKELILSALSLECNEETCKRTQTQYRDIGTKKLWDCVTTNSRQVLCSTLNFTRLSPAASWEVEIKLWLNSGPVPCQGGKGCQWCRWTWCITDTIVYLCYFKS